MHALRLDAGSPGALVGEQRAQSSLENAPGSSPLVSHPGFVDKGMHLRTHPGFCSSGGRTRMRMQAPQLGGPACGPGTAPSTMGQGDQARKLGLELSRHGTPPWAACHPRWVCPPCTSYDALALLACFSNIPSQVKAATPAISASWVGAPCSPPFSSAQVLFLREACSVYLSSWPPTPSLS